ncbi:MAG: SLAC1 anion channel family protein [Wenzhouxiangella sp.]
MSPKPTPLCAHVPLPLFASVMGLCGLAMVWHSASLHWQFSSLASGLITLLAALVFGLLLVLYGYKVIACRERVMAELRHPVRINFLPTLSINLILLGILSREWLPTASLWLWMTGAALQLLFTLLIVTIWIESERPSASINPAWFIPAVGNVLVPIAAVPDGYVLVGWFFMAVGLFFWLTMNTIVFYRLVTKPALEDAMRPTLMILVAPPAVGFLAWLQLSGGLDTFAMVLYLTAVFLAMLLVLQLPRFLRLAYFPSWWAYTFPLAAFTTASYRFLPAHAANAQPVLIALTALSTVVITLVAIRTIIAAVRGELAAH